MIEKLILHIGTHKTGTTYIQENLLKNEVLLNEVSYSLIDRERDASEVKKWLYPKWYGIEDEVSQGNKAREQLILLKENLNKNVIWSEENFSDETSVIEQNIRIEKIKKCLDILGAKSTEIHIFF